jgi:hypothetical protein
MPLGVSVIVVPRGPLLGLTESDAANAGPAVTTSSAATSEVTVATNPASRTAAPHFGARHSVM